MISRIFSQSVFFDWRAIPHTTVCKHTQIYDLTLPQQVYIQHGGGNCCSHNGAMSSYVYLVKLEESYLRKLSCTSLPQNAYPSFYVALKSVLLRRPNCTHSTSLLLLNATASVFKRTYWKTVHKIYIQTYYVIILEFLSTRLLHDIQGGQKNWNTLFCTP